MILTKLYARLLGPRVNYAEFDYLDGRLIAD